MSMMGRPINAKREKMDLKAFFSIFKFAKSYIPFIIVAIIFAVGGAIANIMGPEKIGDLTNDILDGCKVGHIDMKAIGRIGYFLVVLYACGFILSYLQQFIMATISQKTSKNLRKALNKKINNLPLRYFDSTTKGDLLSRVTNDVDSIGQSLSSSTANLIASIVLLFGVLIKMFSLNWILALTTVASSFLGFVCMMLVIKKSQKYFYLKQVDLGKMNGQIEEVYSNQNVVKAFNAEDFERVKFKNINKSLYLNNWRSQFLSGLMQQIMMFVGNISYVAVFVVGVACIVNHVNAIEFGTIAAFIIYSKLFSQPLSTIAQSMTYIQQASAASKRVFAILSQEEQSNECDKLRNVEKVEGNVEFKNVEFEYTEGVPIIKNFSIKLEKGQKIAIVGPTGAGKTTIVNLLMRFYDVKKGEILIDGKPISSMQRECVHDLFDMILQDTWVFDGTIRENLIFNQKDISEKKLHDACEAVGLKHFIDTLPNGYDTMLSDNINLSEGQKQQLTIARAMIKDSPMLILDEATSSVDTRTELIIQEAMDKISTGRTSFVIAHRLSTIKNADIILVMQNGDIVEHGKHEKLLAKKGFYANLYNSQFES